MKAKILLNNEHNGFAGLFMLLCTALCFTITIISLRLSFISKVSAVSNNAAYMVALNLASCYYMNYPQLDENNVKHEGNEAFNFSKKGYYPLNEYNSIMKSTGFVPNSSNCNYFSVSWNCNSKSLSLQFGPMDTKWTYTPVTPNIQNVVIENN